MKKNQLKAMESNRYAYYFKRCGHPANRQIRTDIDTDLWLDLKCEELVEPWRHYSRSKKFFVLFHPIARALYYQFDFIHGRKYFRSGK